MLVGPGRTGKSSTGNTLLGRGQVFDIRGGGASTAASSVTAGRHVTVVDAQGWGSSEQLVPREEKIELLRALGLCGSDGPHVVLLVIPLLDFTEAERRAVESRMELLTSAVWRHTMVLFTLGDWLRGRGHSVKQHIQSGGPALHWLMDKCRYRYHVFENKKTTSCREKIRKQEENRHTRKQARTWWWKGDKEAERKDGGKEEVGRMEGEQEQVRELLSKVEDMLQENGGWHFSLHMYQRLEEEWSRREQKLRAQLEAEKELWEVGSVRRKQEPQEMKINREGEERAKVEFKRQSSEEDVCDTSSDSGGEREEERSLTIEGGKEARAGVKGGMMASCQRLAYPPIRRLE